MKKQRTFYRTLIMMLTLAFVLASTQAIAEQIEIVGTGIGQAGDRVCEHRLPQQVARVVGTAVRFDKSLPKTRVVLEKLVGLGMPCGCPGQQREAVAGNSGGRLQ